jgi:hypothetical protein
MQKAVNKRDIEKEAASRRIAVEVYNTLFVAERELEYQPRRGTVMFQLWQHKRLSLRHQRAWHHFALDLRGASGRSGPVCSGYSEASDKPSGSGKIPTAFVNAEYRRIERLIAMLCTAERLLLKDLIIEEIQAPGHLKLELLGFAGNGFKDDAMARASGATRITCLLDRIAAHYSL